MYQRPLNLGRNYEETLDSQPRVAGIYAGLGPLLYAICRSYCNETRNN